MSGHVLSELLQSQPQHGVMTWYRGELLNMAVDCANRLLPAFNSSTGLPVVEAEIVQWTNERLEASQAGISITHFQDKKIRTSLPLLHLIESLQPGTLDWTNVITPDSSQSLSYQQSMDNAKYAVTMARKIGNLRRMFVCRVVDYFDKIL